MGSRLHIGTSRAADPAAAAEEATRAALLQAESPAMGLVLATAGYDAEALAQEMGQRLRNIPWAGCSAAGVFAGEGLMEQGLAVGILSSKQAYVGVGVAGPVSQSPRAAGAAAVARALDQLPAFNPRRSRTLLVFLNALSGQACEVVRGVLQEAGVSCLLAGGGAGDNLRFLKTAQFARGAAYFDNVVVAALDLPGKIGVGMRHGWTPYGSPTMVTRSRGATALELEYEPAFEIYRRTAASHGDVVTREAFPSFAVTHPLGIPQADGEYVIRDPIAVEGEGGLRCIAEVPDGSLVRVMQGTPEALLGAAREAAASAAAATGAPLAGALVFDCVSRYLSLGPRFPEELEGFRAALGPDVPLMGCLTFGEVGALGSGVAQFHNKTTNVVALPE